MMKYATRTTECPCCEGIGYLVVHEPGRIEDDQRQTHELCTHCMGVGMVPVEVGGDVGH